MNGHRRPGTRGPAALLLAGTLSLGVGGVLGLNGSDERVLVAQDLGALPGPAVSGAGSFRPAAAIPVLAGVDQLVRRPGAGGAVPTAAAAGPAASGAIATAPDAGPAVSGVGPAVPGAAVRGAAPADPGVAVRGIPATIETGPVFADPTLAPVAPRPAPAALPPPPLPLAPKQPGLVSALYPLPVPPPAVRTPVVPALLELPARSVTAPVDAVGTDPSGGMVVPEQVRTVGWWAPGVLPGGGTGSAVIAGHVDSRTQGVGVMAVLPLLAEGEPVLVRDASGRTAPYRVAARREYGKYDLPRDVFRRDGAPQLVLITCGGRFDPATRSYESNIVVYAVPA